MTMPEPQALFARFAMDAGSDDAARARFETFVTHLVKARHRDATTVTSRNHNDWGIDTIVGDLAGGVVRVWQCKFITTWSESSKTQVRDSFKSVTKRAKTEGFTLDVWTLVIPMIFEPKDLQWFQGWAKRESAKAGTRIALSQGDDLVNQLLTAETAPVRNEYFPWTVTEPLLMQEPVAELGDTSVYDGALFIRQLREAGHAEVSAASGQYFATQALLLDLEARGSTAQLRSLNALHHEVHGIWEDRFNDAVPSASPDGRMPELHSKVMADVTKVADPPGIILAAAHKRGAAHHLVERARAGWVTHWQSVAESHTTADAAPSEGVELPAEPSLKTTETVHVGIDAPADTSTASKVVGA